MSNEQIEQMVTRFLQWKLPDGFNPDGGIMFNRYYQGVNGPVKHEPTGTNLFDATQAKEMIEFITQDIEL